MIASALLMPTERPPTLSEVKRALLSYDKLYIPSNKDRELIPPVTFMSSSIPNFPFPIGMDQGPVRPLGKVPGYDDAYEQVLDESEAALRAGLLVPLPAPQYPTGFFIGGVPLPDGTPNSHFVYQVYRAITTDIGFLSMISRGLDELSPAVINDATELAPSGTDDMNITYLPTQAKYPGFVSTEEERNILTKLCYARLGAVVKSIAICELRGLYPITSDVGVASVLQTLNQNTTEVFSHVAQNKEDKFLLGRLSILHDVVLNEYIDQKTLDELPLVEVIKLRTRAWGDAREARSALLNELRNLALEEADMERFEKACQRELVKYQEAQSEFDMETRKLRIRFLSSLGLLTLEAGAAGLAPLAEKAVPAANFDTLLIAGGVGIIALRNALKEAKELGPDYLDLVVKQRELRNMPGYALFRPYSVFR